MNLSLSMTCPSVLQTTVKDLPYLFGSSVTERWGICRQLWLFRSWRTVAVSHASQQDLTLVGLRWQTPETPETLDLRPPRPYVTEWSSCFTDTGDEHGSTKCISDYVVTSLQEVWRPDVSIPALLLIRWAECSYIQTPHGPRGLTCSHFGLEG